MDISFSVPTKLIVDLKYFWKYGYIKNLREMIDKFRVSEIQTFQISCTMGFLGTPYIYIYIILCTLLVNIKTVLVANFN